MPPLFFLRRLPGILALIICITACAPAGKTPDGEGVDDRLALIVRGRVNNGSPLKITLLQLTDPSLFLSAGYEDLQHDAHTALRGQLHAVEQIFLLPGDTFHSLPLAGAGGVRYLGMFAEYQDLAHKRWRLVVPLPPRPAPSLWAMLRPPPPRAIRVAITTDGLQEINDEK